MARLEAERAAAETGFAQVLEACAVGDQAGWSEAVLSGRREASALRQEVANLRGEQQASGSLRQSPSKKTPPPSGLRAPRAGVRGGEGGGVERLEGEECVEVLEVLAGLWEELGEAKKEAAEVSHERDMALDALHQTRTETGRGGEKDIGRSNGAGPRRRRSSTGRGMGASSCTSLHQTSELPLEDVEFPGESHSNGGEVESMEQWYQSLMRRQAGLAKTYSEVQGSLHTVLGTQSFLEGTLSALDSHGETLRLGMQDTRVVLRGVAGASKEEDAVALAGWQARVVDLEAENATLAKQLHELRQFSTQLAREIERWTKERGLPVEPPPGGRPAG